MVRYSQYNIEIIRSLCRSSMIGLIGLKLLDGLDLGLCPGLKLSGAGLAC